MTLFRWSKTIASNDVADLASPGLINWAEGQSPATVNDSARGMMAAVAKWRDDIGGTLTTAGTATAYTINPTNQAFTGVASPPANGTSLTFQVNQANNANATLAIDSGTAYPIQSSVGTAVTAGLLRANTVYSVTFRTGTNAWILNNIYNNPISAGAIGTTELATDAVTQVKMADNSVGTAEIIDLSVTNAEIANATIALGKLATDSGNKGKVIGYDVSTGAAALFTMGGPLLHVRERQNSGTAGTGTFTAAAYRQRPINQTITNEISGAAVASNQITGLPAGTYYCTGYTIGQASGSASNCVMRARLQNITGASALILGSSEFAFVGAATSLQTNISSKFFGRFTLGVTSTIELQGWFANCVGGFAVSSGDDEVYTDLLIWRLA